jgi:hypothetical protein
VLISTIGNPQVPGLTNPTLRDEDVLRCTGTFGEATTCTWALFFDGSDVGLDSSNLEDVDGAAFRAGNLYLSTAGAYTVGGNFTGGGDDIFACAPVTVGRNSACGGFLLVFDGSANGIVDNIDAFSF